MQDNFKITNEFKKGVRIDDWYKRKETRCTLCSSQLQHWLMVNHYS